jgi:hypothetical protein
MLRVLRCRRIMVWSAAGNNAPDKFHTTHDAITSCQFGLDDRLVVMGTQVGCFHVVLGYFRAFRALKNKTDRHPGRAAPCCLPSKPGCTCLLLWLQDGNIVVYDVQHSETVEIIAAHQNGPCRCLLPGLALSLYFPYNYQ